MRAAWGEDFEPDMPPLDGAGYLAGYLFEIGPTVAAGGYPGPVTHSEILAWARLTGTPLAPWEVRALRRLSVDYLAASNRAQERDSAPPWEGGDQAEQRVAVARQMRASIRGLARL